MDEPGKMHFTRMDEGTDADYEVLKEVHEENLADPDLLARHRSTDLDGTMPTTPSTASQHSLQTATRAHSATERDEEMSSAPSCTTSAKRSGPFNHPEIVAAILQPFISEENSGCCSTTRCSRRTSTPATWAWTRTPVISSGTIPTTS